jgi:predicted site-specific integrase-resolvase
MMSDWKTPKQQALDMSVTDRTVRRWLSDGKVPGGVRVGGRWRIMVESDKSDISEESLDKIQVIRVNRQ